MRKITLFAFVLSFLSAAAAVTDKARLVVLTDLANEPDDEESLVRLLAYANEFDFEGLVATTSCHLRENPREDILRHTLDAYAQVWTNLVVHAPDYPTPDFLRSVAASGQPGFGTNSLDVASAGSRLIVAAMKRDDPRPLWVSVWGGPNTLHRALRDCRDELSPEAFAAAQKKLRVYAISDQDDSGPAIRREFPLVTWIVDPSYPYDWRDYWWATWGGISGDVRGVDRAKNLPFVDYVDNAWLKANITVKGGVVMATLTNPFLVTPFCPSFIYRSYIKGLLLLQAVHNEAIIRILCCKYLWLLWSGSRCSLWLGNSYRCTIRCHWLRRNFIYKISISNLSLFCKGCGGSSYTKDSIHIQQNVQTVMTFYNTVDILDVNITKQWVRWLNGTFLDSYDLVNNIYNHTE